MTVRGLLDRKATGEELMVIGFGMCAFGMWFQEFYFEIGGFALFLAGALTLTPIRDKKEEGGLQAEGEDLKPPGPPS